MEGSYRCSCPDYELRQSTCKHGFAVDFAVRRETAPDGTVTETRAMRVTYTQNWPAYNAAQTTEKDHFCRLLRDLVAGVPDRQPATGRRRLPLSDMLFAAAFKVYSTVSARRFMCDLRTAHERGFIRQTPHYNSIFNVMESDTITPILHDLITASSLPLREIECDFAADSTGFGTSQFFRYYSMKYQHEQVGRAWVKLHAMVGTKTNIVTAVVVGDRDAHDSPQLPVLLQATAANFTMREVSADKAYNARTNLTAIESVGAEPFIPFRAGTRPDPKSPTWNRLYHFFALNREQFLEHYHKRSNVEATFSAVKRVFGDSVRSRTPVAQVNEVLLKVVCHNVRTLVHEMHDLGVTPALAGCPVTALAAHEQAAV